LGPAKHYSLTPEATVRRPCERELAAAHNNAEMDGAVSAAEDASHRSVADLCTVRRRLAART